MTDIKLASNVDILNAKSLYSGHKRNATIAIYKTDMAYLHAGLVLNLASR